MITLFVSLFTISFKLTSSVTMFLISCFTAHSQVNIVRMDSTGHAYIGSVTALDSIAAKKNVADSGRSISNYVTGYSLNKVRDSLQANIQAGNVVFNNTPNRSLSTTGSNNTFTVSATKKARLFYTINFAFALALTTSNGYVQLDYSVDAGANWITVGSVSSVYSVAVTLTGNSDAVLSGEIPAGALVRLYRINNTNVTVTAPTTKQLEVSY